MAEDRSHIRLLHLHGESHGAYRAAGWRARSLYVRRWELMLPRQPQLQRSRRRLQSSSCLSRRARRAEPEGADVHDIIALDHIRRPLPACLAAPAAQNQKRKPRLFLYMENALCLYGFRLFRLYTQGPK